MEKRKDAINQNGVITEGVEILFRYETKRVKLIIEGAKYEGVYCYGYSYQAFDKQEGSGKPCHIRDVKHSFNKDALMDYVFQVHSHNFSEKEKIEMRAIVNESRVEQLSLF